MKNNKPTPFMGALLKKIAPKIGATVLIEPKWGIVAQVTFKSGRRRYFRYNTLDLNLMGASDVARDKGYSYFFMQKMGYPIIPSDTFYSDQWARAIGSDKTIDRAYSFAQKIGFPVIVKPNSGSQGVGVALVYSKAEFYKAMKAIWKTDRVAQVQQYITGSDYRIVVLDDKVISAYQRVPLSVVGDGVSSVREILSLKQKSFISSGRDTVLSMNDERIKNKLAHQKLSFSSKIPKGERVYLLDNANLSTGGDSVDVTGEMHKVFKDVAIRLTKDMGLRLCGVDLMVQGTIKEKPGTYFILEVNSAPGLDHYAKTGRAQKKIVEDMYLEVLKSLDM